MYSLVVLISSLLFVQNVQSANILGVFLFPSISHQVVFQAIWKELSLQGHNVTVITPDPLNDPSLKNLTEISVRHTYDILKAIKIQDTMSKDRDALQTYIGVYQLMDLIAEEELKTKAVQKLINERREFDLILTECFHPVMYAFSGRFKAPIIGVSSLGAMAPQYDVIGNPTHPVLYPEILLGYHNEKLTIWQKIKSIVFSISCRIYYHYFILPRADTMAKKYFGDDIPYVGDLEKNMSMLFLNTNPLMYPPRPNVPSIIEMGGNIHIKPVKPLPSDLKKILDEAREGVVYFSLGSNVKSVNLDDNQRNTIIKALSELPYKVLWKWESDSLPGQPKNVIIRKWLPQQDVLAHPNVKVFVTQGGLQSIEEAISREVPLVAMPFMGDQPLNARKLVDLGIALSVDPVTLTKEELKEVIVKVAENVQYKHRIREVRNILCDNLMTGLEKAVWWSEYVIRHKGAEHLRSPIADISWIDYLLLDVFFIFVVIPIVIIFLSFKIVRMMTTNEKN